LSSPGTTSLSEIFFGDALPVKISAAATNMAVNHTTLVSFFIFNLSPPQAFLVDYFCE
jgi:hypothetical protein